MTTKVQPLSAARAGLASVIVTDDPAYRKVWPLTNVGVEDTTGLTAPISSVGAAHMDGVASVYFTPTPTVRGAAQMDGLGQASFTGARASGAAHMDGLASVAFTGIITGGAHIGAAHMDGATDVRFTGTAGTLVSGAAQMDGQGSMLVVQPSVALPTHGITLAAGM